MAAYTGSTTGDREEKVKRPATMIRVHPAVERFWGRPLNLIDLEICQVLGWIRLAGKGRDRRWCLTERTKGYDGQIYRGGVLPSEGQVKVDHEILDFLNQYQRRDLDPFLTRSNFPLRLVLTLVDFELSGIVVRRCETDGMIHFAATAYLATLRKYLEDDDGAPPEVRMNGDLRWDCFDAAEDENLQPPVTH
jgi:hypothetical protein